MKKAILGLLIVFSFAVFSCTNGDDPVEHTVTFDPDNGTAIFTAKVEDGKKAAIPTEPTRSGFTFDAWFLGNNEFDFNTPITSDIELTAKWENTNQQYEITFLDNEGIQIGEKVIVNENRRWENVTKPNVESYEIGTTRYNFSHWSLTEGGTAIANDFVIDAPLTVHAVYSTQQLYTPQFWWGNYIPVEGTHQATPNLSAGVFNLDELVANRDNARKRHGVNWDADVDWDTFGSSWSDDDWDFNNIVLNQNNTLNNYNDSTFTSNHSETVALLGNLRWEETKFSEAAVKNPKQITFNNNLGFMFIIAPADYGDIVVRNASMADVTNTWEQQTVNIDGKSYNIVRALAVQTALGALTFTFQFPN